MNRTIQAHNGDMDFDAHHLDPIDVDEETREEAASMSRRGLKRAREAARPGSYQAASLRAVKLAKRELGLRERSQRRRAARPTV